MRPVRYLSLIVLFMSLFWGCAGIQYTDTVQPIELTASQKQEVSTHVLAKAEGWRNSGVIVREGAEYQVTAEGRWRVAGTCGWTGGDGIGWQALLCWDLGGQIVPGWSGSTLVAKIGENGQPFGIGNKYEFTAQDDGVLFFRINDCLNCCGDNEGYLTVKTTLSSEPPEAKAISGQPKPAKGPAEVTTSYKAQAPPTPKVLVGSVTSVHGDIIEVNVGSKKGVRVEGTGRVFYKAAIDGKEKPIYVANFKITYIAEETSMARIEGKTGEVQVGYLVEIVR